MARYLGNIGINRGIFETSPGIPEVLIEEVEVQGEMRSLGLRWPEAGMGDQLSARHILSIVTPEDTIIDFTEVVWIEWQGRKWDVDSIEYKRPRVELGLGGLYSG